MRRAAITLVCAAIVSACAPEGAATSSSTTRPTVATTTTSTTIVTITTTIPVAPTVPVEDPQERDLLFDVTGIEQGSIAAYAGAGTNYGEVTGFKAGTVALESTGRTDESIDGTIWREIRTAVGTSAWVDDDFLTPSISAPVRFGEFPCSGFGTPEGELARSVPSESLADHVAQIWQIPWADCTRVVIALGSDFRFDGSSPLADLVPEGMTVEAFGTWARVSLPTIQSARSDATEDFGDLTVVVARTAEGPLVIDVHTGGPAEYFARFLQHPARIVIDVLPANDAASLLVPALIGDAVVVAQALPPQANLPLTITGYSRWFEAGGTVVVRQLAENPGGGEVVRARLRRGSVVNPGSGTEWGVSATDWLDAWGVFSFDLEGLGSGEFEIFIGECRTTGDGDTCEDVGVYVPLTVG